MLNCFRGANRKKQTEQRKDPLPKGGPKPSGQSGDLQDAAKRGDSNRATGQRAVYHWLQVDGWGELSLQQVRIRNFGLRGFVFSRFRQVKLL